MEDRHKRLLRAALYEEMRRGQTMFNTVDAGERAVLTPELAHEVCEQLYADGYLSLYSPVVNQANMSERGRELAETLLADERREKAISLLLRIYLAAGGSTLREVELNPIIRAMDFARFEALNYAEYLATLQPSSYIEPVRLTVNDPEYFANPRVRLTECGIEAAMREGIRIGRLMKNWYRVFDWVNRFVPDKALATILLAVLANILTTLLFVLLFYFFNRDFSQVTSYFQSGK